MRCMFSIFKSKWFNGLLSFILLQQALVAGGTYFLGRLTSQFPTDGFSTGTAGALFICILLPGTIVHYWVSWCLTRASKSAQLAYLNKYIEANFNHPTLWRDEKSKQQRHDMMCRAGQETIQSTMRFFADFAATGLNIILNTISIILVTDLALGMIIVMAGFAGLLIIYLSSADISKSSRGEILADNRFNAHLSRSWDNVVLGNRIFYERWKTYFDEYFTKIENASLDVVRKKDWAISMAGLVTNGLVLGFALFLAWKNQEFEGFVLAILVMLPRSLQIVMHIQIIQTYFAQWKNLHEKLLVTQESFLPPQPIDLSPFINQNNIFVAAGNGYVSAENLESQLNNSSSGRFTITGQNGAGKSSLLLKLKNKFGLSAVYLPAHHQLTLCEAQLGLSSGEVALKALQELQTEDCKMLLLDEWDANLSSENRAVLNREIDKLSQKRIVVEVRHSR